MKTQKTLSIDFEVLIELQKKNLNVSKLVNDYLKEFLNIKEDNKGKRLSQLKEEILKEESKLLEKKRITKELEEKVEKEKGEIFKLDGN